MRCVSPSRILIVAMILQGLLACDGAAQFTRVANCQPLIDNGVPTIHALKARNGRLYVGYGEWNDHPGPLVLCAYDPVTHTLVAEHSINSDALAAFREIGDALYIPFIDPIHYKDFTDFAILHPDGHLENRTPVGFYHVFDVLRRQNGEIWLFGSKDNNEWPLGDAAAFRSSDDGITWEEMTSSTLSRPFRYYWGLETGTEIRAAGAQYAASWSTSPPSYDTAGHSGEVTGAAGRFSLLITGQTPASTSIYSGTLVRISETGVVTALASGIVDYAVQGSGLYYLSSSGAVRYFADATAPSFSGVPIATAPPGSRAIAVLGDVLYVGTTGGQIHARSLVGGSVPTTPAPLLNRMPEHAGEALAVEGNTLVVGVPHYSGGKLNSGKVVVYRRDNVDAPWRETDTLEPTGSFGGFFGSHVDVADNVIAVVEGGVMTSSERGKGARVHLYQWNGSIWTLLSTSTQSFAQTARLAGDDLLVGARAALARYRPMASASAQVYSATSHYEDLMVVERDPDFADEIFCGISGDLSRAGAPGHVEVFSLADGNLSNIQSIQTSTGGFDRFGFALEFRAGLLAVGAPRADLAASQAGAVGLFRRSEADGFESVAVLTAPDAGPEDGFGSSVALADDGRLFVGAPMAETPFGRRGAVYVFEERDGTWNLVRKVTPAEGETKTWEFGRTLERDGDTILVASGFADESLPYLDRLTFLDPSTPVDYTEWADRAGFEGEARRPENRGADGRTNLECYALGNDAATLPRIVVGEGTPVFRFLRRFGAETLGLTYTCELSSDLATWSPADDETAVLRYHCPGWESIDLPLGEDLRGARLRISMTVVP